MISVDSCVNLLHPPPFQCNAFANMSELDQIHYGMYQIYRMTNNEEGARMHMDAMLVARVWMSAPWARSASTRG